MASSVCLAKIVAAHGIRGEVKLKSYTSQPKDVCAYGKLFNKDGTRFFEPVFKGFSKGLLLVKFKGVETRNDAEALVGEELFISRDVLPKLQEDTYYQADLIGADVLDAANLNKIGTVVGVYNFGAGDILEIKFEGKKNWEMLPFNNTYVPNVDIQNKTICVARTSMNFQKDEENDA